MRFIPHMLCILSVLLIGSQAAAQTLVKQGQFRDEQPLWVFSGALSPDESSFLLVDVLRNAIIRYGFDGIRIGKPVTSDALLDIDDFRPTFIEHIPTPNGNGEYLVESGNGHFLWFEAQTFKLVRELEVAGRTNREGLTIGAITTWTATEDVILAFGDLHDSRKTWSSGYLQIPLANPDAFKVVLSLPVDSPERSKHYFGYSFSAPLPASEGGAAILWDDRIQVLSNDLERPATDIRIRSESDKALAAREEPAWSQWNDSSNAVEKFRQLSSSTSTLDIHIQENFVYLLHRKATGWNFARISRSGDEPSLNRELPTNAEHLVMIPGSQRVLFLEKGPVVGIGDQQVRSFFWIDDFKTWIEADRQ